MTSPPTDTQNVPHMGDDEPSRRRETFSRNELATVLSHYDLGIIESIRPLRRGSRLSPKLVIRTSRGSFVLKRRAPGRHRPRRVAFTHSLMVHLYERGYPAPAIVGTRDDNNSMLQLGETVYEVFEYVMGERYPRDVKAARHAGIALAHMHRLLRSFSSTYESPIGGYHGFPGLRTRIDAIPGAVHETHPSADLDILMVRLERLAQRAGEARERVDELGFRAAPAGIGHGDWHPGNLLYRGAAVAAVVDYDSARREPFIADAANGLLQFSMHIGTTRDPLGWPIGLETSLVRAFWSGYDDGSRHAATAWAREMVVWLIIEALIVESVLPISTTGSFGRMPGDAFLRIIDDQVTWMLEHREDVRRLLEPAT